MWRSLDPELWVLCGGLVFFTFVLIYVQHLWNNDGQVFQVFSNLLAGFGGALWTRIKGEGRKEDKKDDI